MTQQTKIEWNSSENRKKWWCLLCGLWSVVCGDLHEWYKEFCKFLLELRSGGSLTVDRLKLSNIEIKYKYEENSEFKTQLSQRRNSTQYSEEEQAKVNNNNSQPGSYLGFLLVLLMSYFLSEQCSVAALPNLK